MTAENGTFTIARTLAAPIERVWQAFADKQAKQAWFAGPPGWTRYAHDFDFRVGGEEFSSVGEEGGPRHIFRAHFYDIVDTERIVYAYEMYRDDVRMSVSLALIELEAEGDQTTFRITENGIYFGDDPDWGGAGREEGTGLLADALVASVLDGDR